MHSWSSPPLPEIPKSTQVTRARLYDSSTKSFLETPRNVESAFVGMYVCGITPYDATHIGHASTYIAFDILNRLWRDLGYTVEYVQNVTDVDDPLLERATLMNRDWAELATEQIELFQEDMVELRVISPTHYIGAVESIPLVVEAIERLIDDGFAYRVSVPETEQVTQGSSSEDVYFDIAQSPGFGDVSRYDSVTMEALFAERGGDPKRVGKRNILDPLLWRSARVDEPSWPGASLGDGRPGWHIECAVIAARHLSMPFEVQAGGSDLLFPHHEMSAVHGEALVGADSFARQFSHAGMVAYDGEKMSKSRGNLVFVSGLRRAGVDPMAIRLAILAHHYRSDWEWTASELEQAEQRLEKWRSAFSRDPNTLSNGAYEVISRIRTALADDLDSPGALQAVDDWVQETESSSSSVAGSSQSSTRDVKNAVDALLGII